MDLEMKGEVAVVAGGARGIGLAIARAFRAEGARVALLDRDPAVEEVARDLGGDTLPLRCDVTDYPALQTAALRALELFGRLDHVVFAAAVGSGKFGFPFWNLDPADWPRVLHVSVTGAACVAHAFAPLLVKAKYGSLLFLASIAGQIGSPTDPPYSASKAALINFMQCAARDLAPHGVRANALSPGMVRTELNRSVWEAWAARQTADTWQSYDDWTADKIRRVVPLGRWQTPEDLAAMAVFLASRRAANVTGQTVNVDGGTVMHS